MSCRPIQLKRFSQIEEEAQERRFLKAYDITKAALEKFKIWPRNKEEQALLVELDELETGYPMMTLAHLYDVIKQISAIVGEEEDPYLSTPIFSQNRDELKKIIKSMKPESHKFSWWSLQGKLGKISRAKNFRYT